MGEEGEERGRWEGGTQGQHYGGNESDSDACMRMYQLLYVSIKSRVVPSASAPHIRTRAHRHACTHTGTHACMHAHRHAHTYTHVRTHTHTYVFETLVVPSPLFCLMVLSFQVQRAGLAGI